MKSIRSFLLWRLLGGAALVLGAAGIGVYVFVARSLEAQFDRNLADRAKGFASLLFQTEQHVEFEFSDQLMPEYSRAEQPAYFELWFEDGRLLETSDSLRGKDLVLPESARRVPLHWSAPLPDGRDGRYVSQLLEVHHVYPEEGPDRPQAANVVVAVARGREELIAAERATMIYCATLCGALIALIAFSSWKAVERGLAPARRLAATLDAIQVDRLPEHLELGEVPVELAPVADKTDALIRKLGAALERERRTTADIAHELRTPISELVTVAEVALRDGRDPGGASRALSTVRDVAWRMGRAVSTILKLARLEMGAETFSSEPVELGEIVGDLVRSLAALERERALSVQNLVDDAATVEGDREVLRIIVSNLLSNALYYSPRGGTVECRLEDASDGWSLAVENGAGELRPEDMHVLAEPFWRKDGARSDRDRSGLGLALSRALAQKTGLQLEFELAHGRFRALLRGRGAVRVHAAAESA